jgi:hypothetical protein
MLATSCGSQGPPEGAEPPPLSAVDAGHLADTGTGDAKLAPRPDASSLFGGDSGSLVGDAATSGIGCSEATQYVYVVDVSGTMYKFDPPTLAFTQVGQLTCAPAGAYSMAVDRNAVAWVLLQNEQIVRYDIRAKTCTLTSFAPGQMGFYTFGMGFSADAAGGSAETLFVSDATIAGSSNRGLASINTSSLVLTPIAMYDSQAGKRAELTGDGNGNLYGAFEGSPYVVAQIDKTTAHIVSAAPQTAISYPPDSSNFAFAFWGGDFWLFVGPGGATDVFQYRPSTGTTTKRETESFEIVGAGVSTCAPTRPPQ